MICPLSCTWMKAVHNIQEQQQGWHRSVKSFVCCTKLRFCCLDCLMRCLHGMMQSYAMERFLFGTADPGSSPTADELAKRPVLHPQQHPQQCTLPHGPLTHLQRELLRRRGYRQPPPSIMHHPLNTSPSTAGRQQSAFTTLQAIQQGRGCNQVYVVTDRAAEAGSADQQGSSPCSAHSTLLMSAPSSSTQAVQPLFAPTPHSACQESGVFQGHNQVLLPNFPSADKSDAGDPEARTPEALPYATEPSDVDAGLDMSATATARVFSDGDSFVFSQVCNHHTPCTCISCMLCQSHPHCM